MDKAASGFEFIGLNVSVANAVALFIATATVLLLIYGRHEIRVRRLAALRDYIRTYPHTANLDSVLDPGPYDLDPSFEYAKSKYSSDLGAVTSGNSPRDRIAEIEASIRRATFFRGGTVSMLLAGTGYWAVVYAGFLLALGGSACGEAPTPCHPLVSFLTTGGLDASKSQAAALQAATNTLTVGSFAFIGAYAASVRYMLRALSTFDLNAFTFIRQAAMIGLATLLVMGLYRAAPEINVNLGTTAANAASSDNSPPFAWLLVALALGLLPGSIFQFILTRAGSNFTWVKSSDDRFLEWTRVVPLDVIDGIDYFTRFRLEECGISDVQALATYNPIMLHIESPYRIYQALDWITQAQLCCVVGLDRFLLLRQFNIRTIFDLERALKEERVTEPARAVALDRFDHIYAGILFSPNSAMRGIEEISKVKLLVPAEDGMKEVSASEYSSWARTQINDPAMLSFAIEHLMTWISDDLHVRRSRRIWNEISTQLGPASITLYDDATIRSKNADNPKGTPQK